MAAFSATISEEDRKIAADSVGSMRDLEAEMSAAPQRTLRLSVEGTDQQVSLPAGIIPLLHVLLQGMAEGKLMQMFPTDVPLSEEQLAELLQFSKRHIHGLMEREELRTTVVNKRKVVLLSDALDYYYNVRLKRLQLLAEITRLGQEMESGE